MNTDPNTGCMRLRASLLQLIIKNNMSVREFKTHAKRTRLRDFKNLIKVEQHIYMWKKYNWVQTETV